MKIQAIYHDGTFHIDDDADAAALRKLVRFGQPVELEIRIGEQFLDFEAGELGLRESLREILADGLRRPCAVLDLRVDHAGGGVVEMVPGGLEAGVLHGG